MIKAITLFASILLVLGACARTPNSDAASIAPASENAEKGAAGANAAESGDLTITEGDTGSGEGEAGSYGSQAGTLRPKRCEPEKDCVVAFVAEDLDWGCPTLRRGDTCKIPFMGYFALLSGEQGSIAFQAFEDDAPVPTVSQELTIPPLPRRGSFNPNSTRLIYQVGAHATKVTFQVVLKNAAGVITARSIPSTYPITG